MIIKDKAYKGKRFNLYISDGNIFYRSDDGLKEVPDDDMEL